MSHSANCTATAVYLPGNSVSSTVKRIDKTSIVPSFIQIGIYIALAKPHT